MLNAKRRYCFFREFSAITSTFLWSECTFTKNRDFGIFFLFKVLVQTCFVDTHMHIFKVLFSFVALHLFDSRPSISLQNSCCFMTWCVICLFIYFVQIQHGISFIFSSTHLSKIVNIQILIQNFWWFSKNACFWFFQKSTGWFVTEL